MLFYLLVHLLLDFFVLLFLVVGQDGFNLFIAFRVNRFYFARLFEAATGVICCYRLNLLLAIGDDGRDFGFLVVGQGKFAVKFGDYFFRGWQLACLVLRG